VTAALKARFTLARGPGFALDIDADIPPRGATGIYGPSGCGKTTLLYALAGLLPIAPDGEIAYRGTLWRGAETQLPTHRRRIGFVFQDARLFPHLSVGGNLDFAEKRRHRGDGPSRSEVCEWLEIGGLLRRPVRQLSRGQEQRVAMARALLSAPDILFMDEPLANIDLGSRAEILHRLEKLHRELDIPIVYVSHDMEELSRLADWLLVMDSGRITAQGPLLELCSRLEPALAREERAAAILLATVTGRDERFELSELEIEGQTMFIVASGAPPGSALRLRVPARDVSLCLEPPRHSSILNILRVRIAEIEDAPGARLLVRLKLGDQYLLARITRKSVAALGLGVGDEVYAQIKSVALLNRIQD